MPEPSSSRRPAALPSALQVELRRSLAQPAPTLALADSSDWAEQFHLLALCERRVLQHEMPWQTRPQDGALHATPLLRAAHAALLLFLLVRNYDKTQHVCANLAYAHQKLAPDLGEPHWQMAVRWHALSFGLHASFGGVESSAWEYIYLGELWLDSPQAREACRTPGLDASWGDDTPAQLSFYDRACRIAEQIGEPRQMAYTLLNRQRFATQLRAPRARDDSLRRLRKLLQAHPELERLLLRENYSLPRQARRV